jgi:hypothetical protein
MTPRQIDLARHALGLPNKRRCSYRNHFVTGPGCTDWDDWQAMVAAGDARRYEPSTLTGGDYCFVLTRQGAEVAVAPGERLDREAWPMVTRKTPAAAAPDEWR